MQEDQAHLQQDLELAGERRRLAVGKRFGAISALQQEPTALLRLGDLALERLDFPRHDDRRQLRERGDHARQRRRIAIDRLLQCRVAGPARRTPIVGGRVRGHGKGCYRGTLQCKRKRLIAVESRPTSGQVVVAENGSEPFSDRYPKRRTPLPRKMAPSHFLRTTGIRPLSGVFGMDTVLVLGAGKIGSLVSGLLAECGDYSVQVADVSAEVARSVVRAHVLPSMDAFALDAADKDALAAHLTRHRIAAVVSSLPFYCNVAVAEAARAAAAHYFDLTEDVEVTRAVRRLAQGAEQAFVPQCGLAPGFVSIAANSLIGH